MKKRTLSSPRTFGLDVALVMLALLIAGCGAIGPTSTTAPADEPTALDTAFVELDSLIQGIGSDVLSVTSDLAADAASTAAAFAATDN